ncbi:MAG: sigma-70 family RNA polymerase sigma factor [Bacteroidaceae bacterium]|nr:sigma-70 family RNA polymerase sigma factor [Bacteroidaceae bacterium]
MTNDDNIIIERIRGGETSEFAQLVKRYGPSLMVFVGRIVAVQEDTEDVVQNTFVAAYQHLNDYDSQKASVSTWLQRIAYHEALYHLRKRKRQVMLPLNISDDIPDELPEDTTAQQLDEAIQQLSPEDQMLLQLFYFDGRSLKEIAYITGKADDSLNREVSRLSSQLHRIRQKLSIILTHRNHE